MHSEVLKYRQYTEDLPNRIKNSVFKTATIIEKTGIPKASFYKKLKLNNFTQNEVEKISKVLYVEDLINEGIRKGEEDIAAGRIIKNPKQAIDDLIKKIEQR